MGAIERELSPQAVAKMDQVEAHALNQLRELVKIQQELHEECGEDTSPIFLATMLAEAAEERWGNSDHFVIPLANIVGMAAKILAVHGWLENESLPVEG